MTDKPSAAKRTAFAWAVFVLAAGVVAAAMVASAGPLYRDEAITLSAAFDLMRKGAWTGLGAAAGGLVGVAISLLTRRATAAVLAFLALAVGAVAFGWPYVLYRETQTMPPIHDVATDPAHPPQFIALAAVRRAAPDGLAYGGGGAQVTQAEQQALARFLDSRLGQTRAGYRRVMDACRSWGPACLAAVQQTYYPGVRPLPVPGADPARVFAAALALARDMDWDVAVANRTARHIEATAVTSWFGFKEDVAIDVSPDGPGSVVNMRSESRLGLSDAGDNADRVRAYLGRLAHRMLPAGG
jgi:uncharacterized protein (DUF1499 family)